MSQSKEKVVSAAFTHLKASLLFVVVLSSFLIAGVSFFGFSRNPQEIFLIIFYTISLDCIFELILMRRIRVPLGALISSLSLAALLDFPYDSAWIFIPPFLTVASKYLIRYKERHFFNPSLAGIVFSILLFPDKINIAPAFQWIYSDIFPLIVFLIASVLILPIIKRFYLFFSFVLFFALFTLFRYFLWNGIISFETLFLGNLLSPAFIIFSAFMITDPGTSPKGKREQIVFGFGIAFLEFLYNFSESYYTFFFGGFTWSLIMYFRKQFLNFNYDGKLFVKAASLIAIVGFIFHSVFLNHKPEMAEVNFSFEEMPSSLSKVGFKYTNYTERLLPGLQHIQKWLHSSIGGMATGDINKDGSSDLIVVRPSVDSNFSIVIYLYESNYVFRKFSSRTIVDAIDFDKKKSLPVSPLLIDYDFDGDLDLYINFNLSYPHMFKNLIQETGQLKFKDVSKKLGLDQIEQSYGATFLDIDKDGDLDLFTFSYFKSFLKVGEKNYPLNFFEKKWSRISKSKIWDIMPENWALAKNSDFHRVFLFDKGRFNKVDSKEWGLYETPFALSIGTGDFNRDGFTDIYIANDFGPDDLLINQGGKGFQRIEGLFFGDVGLDTFKGMNVGIADITNSGFLDIYISNIHHPLAIEGSMFLSFDALSTFDPSTIKNYAYQYGALNQSSHGWGASLVDLNKDGYLDIVQTNGMLDTKYDEKVHQDRLVYKFLQGCPDYWYLNEKLARSPAYVQRYAENWGDIRGSCIMQNERDRVLVSNGNKKSLFFHDVASQVGFNKKRNTRSVIAVDFENNGNTDLVTLDIYGGLDIFKYNSSKNKNQWLGLILESHSSKCNREAFGSTIKVSHKDKDGRLITQMRELSAINGFSGQEDHRQIFGLGLKPGPVEVLINWCGLEQVVYKNIELGKYNKLTY